jgi:hypothetical protein
MAATMTNQNGQASVESIFVATFLLIIVFTTLMACYISFSSYWIHHNLYEGLICYTSTKQKFLCEKQTQNKIEKILLTSQQRVDIFLEGRTLWGRYKLHMPFGNFLSGQNQILFEEKIKI